MLAFEVNDMTCGHCAGTITQAINAADQEAKVSIDPRRHLVTIERSSLNAQYLEDAIRQAGYSPVAVQAAAAATPAGSKSCCGHCH
jgi:copper chaperone